MQTETLSTTQLRATCEALKANQPNHYKWVTSLDEIFPAWIRARRDDEFRTVVEDIFNHGIEGLYAASKWSPTGRRWNLPHRQE